MLTTLSFLQKGEPWPPKAEVARLDQYRANKLLFESKHDEVFKDWLRLLRDDQKATLEFILNWHKRLSLLWCDLLLGEPPVYTAGEKGSAEQKTVERLVSENDLNVVAYEVALDVSRYGDGLFKVRLEDGSSVITGQPPDLWFPVIDRADVRKIEAHVLAWTFDEKVKRTLRSDLLLKFLRVEVHRKGVIHNRLFRLGDPDRTIEREESLERFFPDVPEAEQTGVNDFLVVYAPGVRATDRLHGFDDYRDLETLVQEMEVRLAQISRILDKHADPSMAGPPHEITTDDAGNPVYVGGSRYFEVEEGGHVPQYVTWDGKLDAAFKEIEELKEQLYFVSETTPAAFGQLKQGLAESGSALRRLMMAPLAKVARIRTRFDPALKKALKVAADLERANGKDTPEISTVQIQWQDGLPPDPKEQAETEEVRVRSGTTSRSSAIRRLDGVTQDEAESELGHALEEQPALGNQKIKAES